MSEFYWVEEVVNQEEVIHINNLIRNEPNEENWGPFIMHHEILTTTPYEIFALKHDDLGLIGYSILLTTADDFSKGGEIFKLYVLSKFRGKGFASRLVNHSVAHFKCKRSARTVLTG